MKPMTDQIEIVENDFTSLVMHGDSIIPIDNPSEERNALTRRGYRMIRTVRTPNQTCEVWERKGKEQE